MTIEEFIEENLDLIDANEWDKVYEKAVVNLISADVGKFTEVMLKADVHPENYLTTLPRYFLYGSSYQEFIIPNHITMIGYLAFSSCHNLTNVIIPDSVTSISASAFSDCYSLTSVTIPNGVTSINDWVFSGCSSLTSVVIPDSVTGIGERAFSYCDSLTSITIPDGVTSIDEAAFFNCTSLENITIPNNVVNIGDYAFTYCGDNLVIEYNGRKSDWKKIYTSKAFENTYFTVNCIDGTTVKKKR